MEKNKDKVVSIFLDFIKSGEAAIERGYDVSYRELVTNNGNTTLFDLFNSDEKLFVYRRDNHMRLCTGHFILLTNNRLLTVGYNEEGTGFLFRIYPEGDKCFASCTPLPNGFKPLYKICDSKGKTIGYDLHIHTLDGTCPKVLLKDIIKPISVETIKERAGVSTASRAERQTEIIEKYAILWDKEPDSCKKLDIFTLFNKFIYEITEVNNYSKDIDLNEALIAAINDRIEARGGDRKDVINRFLLKSIELIEGSNGYCRKHGK